jgi:hypothetical protein
VLCQLSYAPRVATSSVARRSACGSEPQSGTTLPKVHRRALGFLFSFLAIGLGLIAALSALEGGRAWVIAAAAAALALWMAGLARRAL